VRKKLARLRFERRAIATSVVPRFESCERFNWLDHQYSRVAE
jgi:hypothetical protein